MVCLTVRLYHEDSEEIVREIFLLITILLG